MNLENYPINQILLATNGSESLRPALECGGWLAETLALPVQLLGIVEDLAQRRAVETQLAEEVRKLERAAIPSQTRLVRGEMEGVLQQTVRQNGYLTVTGPLGHSTWQRWLRGGSFFRHLLEDIPGPLIYTGRVRLPLRRFLLCLGGLDYDRPMIRFALELARKLGAEVTFLHIVGPVTLDYPLAREVHTHWQDLMHTATPQGRSLRQALESARLLGVPAQVKVRHGEIIPEILGEAYQKNYDLLGMGSPFSCRSLRRLYYPNVTAEVAEHTRQPVLVLRATEECGALS